MNGEVLCEGVQVVKCGWNRVLYDYRVRGMSGCNNTITDAHARPGAPRASRSSSVFASLTSSFQRNIHFGILEKVKIDLAPPVEIKHER